MPLKNKERTEEQRAAVRATIVARRAAAALKDKPGSEQPQGQPTTTAAERIAAQIELRRRLHGARLELARQRSIQTQTEAEVITELEIAAPVTLDQSGEQLSLPEPQPPHDPGAFETAEEAALARAHNHADHTTGWPGEMEAPRPWEPPAPAAPPPVVDPPVQAAPTEPAPAEPHGYETAEEAALAALYSSARPYSDTDQPLATPAADAAPEPVLEPAPSEDPGPDLLADHVGEEDPPATERGTAETKEETPEA